MTVQQLCCELLPDVWNPHMYCKSTGVSTASILGFFNTTVGYKSSVQMLYQFALWSPEIAREQYIINKIAGRKSKHSYTLYSSTILLIILGGHSHKTSPSLQNTWRLYGWTPMNSQYPCKDIRPVHSSTTRIGSLLFSLSLTISQIHLSSTLE